MGAVNALYSMFEPTVKNVLGKDGPRYSSYAFLKRTWQL